MHCRGACNKEPKLSELLEDPMVILLMHRDGVTRGDVEALVRNIPIRPKNEESKVKNCACGYSDKNILHDNYAALIGMPCDHQ